MTSDWACRLISGLLVVLAVCLGLHYNGVSSLGVLQTRPEAMPVWISEYLKQIKIYIPIWRELSVGIMILGGSWLFYSVLANFKQAQADRRVEENVGVLYCTNKMTADEFNDMSTTRQAVMELINSKEYRAMMKTRVSSPG